MKFNNVVIHSFGYDLSETEFTSAAIEQRLSPIYEKLKLPEGRLELMTGISARRQWAPGTKPSDLSTAAARACLKNSQIKAEEIDLLVHASVCRDFLEPATASVVHANLGLSPKAMIFDLSNACLGVINAIVVAGNMIESGQIKTALIVSGENGGPLLESTINELLTNPSIDRKNIKKYIANLTIGSAATAFLITHKDLSLDSPRVLGGAVMTDSSANHLCRGDGNTHSLVMETDSEELLKYGIALGKDTWMLAKNNLSWTNSDVDFVLTHQVGSAHEKLSLESLELDKTNTFRTYPFLGNTGSSALPITLMMANEKGLIKKGDNVALLGIGSGLSSIMLGVQW
ncbi:3-oxoacyl-ACP synthase III [Bacteriovorax stolpii]|uniref:3-oxoacyl-ACP synthase III n=1 Tax=Bacteriovorax stolpii TaxID=960 RepID=A0A2K9NRK9_BACTC|nr:3-oxoacyl-ACP synthase III [Bacteriovorax stolpii]AUN98132.1 3-oxoacyl-ACP synthase III [Bacteriovorax stolpii]QDK41888.1 3-oxoacyl-ACP synthase III [Bacteriovorax stolpii]TDP52045.1 3-oxoacyl-[acyl-carrier-protein] synthase-3 [Bacteriovorax stolpii]